MPGVPQVPGSVECVKSSHGEVGCIADVVQPCGCFQQIGARAENWCQAVCSGGDTLDVRPAAGQRLPEERLGELLRP